MRSIEALWTLRADAPGGEDFELSGGVMIFESGRIFGGDSGYAYVGTLDEVGQSISGTVKVLRHDRSVHSIWGDADEFEITFSGRRVSEDRIEGSLDGPGAPTGNFVLNRLAELP